MCTFSVPSQLHLKQLIGHVALTVTITHICFPVVGEVTGGDITLLQANLLEVLLLCIGAYSLNNLI